MHGGIKNAKNIVKLLLMAFIGIGGLVVLAIVARLLVFNGRVAPIFNTVLVSAIGHIPGLP